jgi:hypothetical protein
MRVEVVSAHRYRFLGLHACRVEDRHGALDLIEVPRAHLDAADDDATCELCAERLADESAHATSTFARAHVDGDERRPLVAFARRLCARSSAPDEDKATFFITVARSSASTRHFMDVYHLECALVSALNDVLVYGRVLAVSGGVHTTVATRVRTRGTLNFAALPHAERAALLLAAPLEIGPTAFSVADAFVEALRVLAKHSDADAERQYARLALHAFTGTCGNAACPQSLDVVDEELFAEFAAGDEFRAARLRVRRIFNESFVSRHDFLDALSAGSSVRVRTRVREWAREFLLEWSSLTQDAFVRDVYELDGDVAPLPPLSTELAAAAARSMSAYTGCYILQRQASAPSTVTMIEHATTANRLLFFVCVRRELSSVLTLLEAELRSSSLEQAPSTELMAIADEVERRARPRAHGHAGGARARAGRRGGAHTISRLRVRRGDEPSARYLARVARSLSRVDECNVFKALVQSSTTSHLTPYERLGIARVLLERARAGVATEQPLSRNTYDALAYEVLFWPCPHTSLDDTEAADTSPLVQSVFEAGEAAVRAPGTTDEALALAELHDVLAYASINYDDTLANAVIDTAMCLVIASDGTSTLAVELVVGMLHQQARAVDFATVRALLERLGFAKRATIATTLEHFRAAVHARVRVRCPADAESTLMRALITHPGTLRALLESELIADVNANGGLAFTVALTSARHGRACPEWLVAEATASVSAFVHAGARTLHAATLHDAYDTPRNASGVHVDLLRAAVDAGFADAAERIAELEPEVARSIAGRVKRARGVATSSAATGAAKRARK